MPELRSLRPRRLDCRRYHSQPGLRPALRMAVRFYTGHTDRTNRVARAAIQFQPSTTIARPGAKRVQAGRHRDDPLRRKGPWPKVGPPYAKRWPKTPKVMDKVLVTGNTSGCSFHGTRKSGSLLATEGSTEVFCRANTMCNTFGVLTRRFRYGSPAFGHRPCSLGKSSCCIPA